MKDSPITLIASAFAIIGALFISANVELSNYGFIFFLISSVIYTVVAYKEKIGNMFCMQASFAIINLFAIWRWFF